MRGPKTHVERPGAKNRPPGPAVKQQVGYAVPDPAPPWPVARDLFGHCIPMIPNIAPVLPEEFLVPRLRAPTWPRGARPPPPPPPNAAAHVWPQPLGNPGAAPRDLVANSKKTNGSNLFKNAPKSSKKLLVCLLVCC